MILRHARRAAYLFVLVALEVHRRYRAVGLRQPGYQLMQRVVQRGVLGRAVVPLGHGLGWGSAPPDVDACASRHAPYPYGLFLGHGDAEELFAKVPERQRSLLQQVVDLQAVAAVAAADREEQPAVAEHQLIERFCVLHTIITYFESEKLQAIKKNGKLCQFYVLAVAVQFERELLVLWSANPMGQVPF